MPVGVTLLTLRRELRAETGASLNPQQGVQAQQTLDLILARQQQELWDAYDWRHLRYFKETALQAGGWIYDWPPGFTFDTVTDVLFAVNAASRWKPLTYGIDVMLIPPGGVTPKGTPTYWDNHALVTDGTLDTTYSQLQLFPAASSNDMLVRCVGMAPLARLTDDTDRCSLDSKLITLFAAAEILATQKSEAAPVKLTKAQNYLRRLLADQGASKRRNYNMGGPYKYGIDPDRARRTVPYIDYMP